MSITSSVRELSGGTILGLRLTFVGADGRPFALLEWSRLALTATAAAASYWDFEVEGVLPPMRRERDEPAIYLRVEPVFSSLSMLISFFEF